MADFQSIIQSPEFQALQPNEQIAQLAGVDPEFKKLTPQVQGELLNLYRAKYGWPQTGSFEGYEGANPLPSGGYKVTGADLMRYGPPVAAGVAGGLISGGPGVPLATRAATLAGEATVDFLSEYFARGMEGEEQESRIKGGLTAAGLGLGMFATFKGIGMGTRKIAKKVMMPKNVPNEAVITQEILSRYGTKKGSVSFGRFGLGKNAQETEETLIYYLESIARSGYGGAGRMSRMDIFNQKEVLKGYQDFLQKHVEGEFAPVNFGQFMKSVLGEKGASYGSWFDPYMAIKKAQYDVLDERLAMMNGQVFVDGRAVREEAIRMGEEKLLNMKELPPIKGKGSEGWETLSPQQANALKENINSYHGTDESYNRLLSKINKEIRNPLEATLQKADKEAYNAYKAANATWSELQSQLEATTINTIRKKIESEPSTILHYLTSEGSPYDKLQRMKALVRRSQELGAESAGIGFSESVYQDYFEKHILRPIKFETIRPSLVVDRTTGQVVDFDSRTLIKSLENQLQYTGAEGQNFLDEVWGSRETWRELYKFAAADEFLKRAYGESIFIKLAQAGALGGAFLGKLGKTTSAVLLAPYFLSHIFSSPKLVRMITENAKMGWKMGTSSRATRKLIQMRLAAERELSDLHPNAVQYYSGAPENAPPQ